MTMQREVEIEVRPGVQVHATVVCGDGKSPIVTRVVINAEQAGITADDVRAVHLRAITERAEVPPDLLPLVKRAGMSSKEFSGLVAQHYRAWAALTRNPVAAMAKRYKISPRTLATWVREARLRGLLPPAKVYQRRDSA